MSGLAIEAATDHVEVLVTDADGEPLAHQVEDVGHGHTRRLASLVRAALDRAGVAPRALEWVGADLGPGSFTGVRVGLATASALAMAAGARLLGASSLASLAHGAGERRALVVPLVPAGRRDLYAGFFRADTRGGVRLVAAPMVGTVPPILEWAREAAEAVSDVTLRFVGPGAGREREALEAAFPGSTSPPFRHEGLSAIDLARACGLGLGPAAGLAAPGESPRPLYVRPAQAEERVRRRVLAAEPTTLRPFRPDDLPVVAEIEQRVFSDPWSVPFFQGELDSPQTYARIAEREGRLAGYSLAWLGEGEGHLGNIAVIPEARRHGVARALLEDLLREAHARRVRAITLEVRVSNDAAQGLYQAFGFRVAGVRRRYYRDTGEDALVMRWSEGGSGHVVAQTRA